MLKKLLKYDYKAVLKYWWIAAASSVLLSILGGFCISVFRAKSTEEIAIPEVIFVGSVLLFIIVIIGLCAFALLSQVLIFVRFYKNFFSDEGYLTFTLPVKLSELLNSKLIMSTVVNIMSMAVIFLNVTTMLVIGFSKEIFTKTFFKEIAKIISEIIEQIDVYVIVYLIELLVLLFIGLVFTQLFMFACITFASMITKKAKLITAVGIYYAANSLLSFGITIFNIFGTSNLEAAFALFSNDGQKAIAVFILLGIVLFATMILSILYTFEYWMLDRKLNLA